jgi:hypothetical protein
MFGEQSMCRGFASHTTLKTATLKKPKARCYSSSDGLCLPWAIKRQQAIERLSIPIEPAGTRPPTTAYAAKLLNRLGFDHLAATVKAVRAYVVTQMGFASGWLYCNAWGNQSIVRAVHTALGWRFFVLLNCHGGLLVLLARYCLNKPAKPKVVKMVGFAALRVGAKCAKPLIIARFLPHG